MPPRPEIFEFPLSVTRITIRALEVRSRLHVIDLVKDLPQEHGRLFSAAGFSDVEVLEEGRGGWLCIISKRPQ